MGFRVGDQAATKPRLQRVTPEHLAELREAIQVVATALEEYLVVGVGVGVAPAAAATSVARVSSPAPLAPSTLPSINGMLPFPRRGVFGSPCCHCRHGQRRSAGARHVRKHRAVSVGNCPWKRFLLQPQRPLFLCSFSLPGSSVQSRNRTHIHPPPPRRPSPPPPTGLPSLHAPAFTLSSFCRSGGRPPASFFPRLVDRAGPTSRPLQRWESWRCLPLSANAPLPTLLPR